MIKNNKTNISNQADLFGTKNKEKTKTETETDSTKPKDTATYIPSSTFSAKTQTLNEYTAREYEQLMTNADKALKEAEKYI
ncbi:MAG: hypothetical protein IJ877_01510 [Candidatus Gastranaerophilales bacterium]|nr:hypothetical protein [Candidatus Gastranaerophilales bacterium]